MHICTFKNIIIENINQILWKNTSSLNTKVLSARMQVLPTSICFQLYSKHNGEPLCKSISSTQMRTF